MTDSKLIIFSSGSTYNRDEIMRESIQGCNIHCGSDKFRNLIGEVRFLLKKLFETENDVIISTSSGTGLWEGSIRNCVSNTVLHLNNGPLGELWSQISEKCGKKVIRLNFDYGEPVNPFILDNTLKLMSETDNLPDAVCMIHNETSTGVISDLSQISKVIMQYPSIIWIVDAISSLGGVRIPVDHLGIDVCISSSQIALALPPGLSFASISPKTLSKLTPDRGFYFDFETLTQTLFHYTPSITILLALRKQFNYILSETLTVRENRHLEMRDLTIQWAYQNNFKIMSNPQYRSPTVTTLIIQKDINLNDLRNKMISRGYYLDIGDVTLNRYMKNHNLPQTFRIGHMGDHSIPQLLHFLNTLKSCLDSIY